MKRLNIILSGLALSSIAVAKIPLFFEADLGLLASKDKQYHKSTVSAYGVSSTDINAVTYGYTSHFGQIGASSGYQLNKKIGLNMGAYFASGHSKQPYDVANSKTYSIEKKRQISINFMPTYKLSHDHSVALILGYGFGKKKFFGLFNSTANYIADSTGPELGVKFDLNLSKKLHLHLKSVLANMTDHNMTVATESRNAITGGTAERVTKPSQRSFDSTVSMGLAYNIL